MNGYPPGPPGYGSPPNYGGPPPIAPNSPPQQQFQQQQPAGGFGYAPQQQQAPQAGYGQPNFAPPPAYGYGPAPGMPMQAGYGYPPVTAGAPSLRWWVLGTFVGMFVAGTLSVAIAGALGGTDAGGILGGIFSLLMGVLMIGYIVTALMWLYKSWEMLPPSARITDGGVSVTPGTAVGYLFIPFYNLYWYFITSVGLTSALNRALASYGSPKRASGGLAIAACVMQMIPYVNMLACFIWIAFMLNVESAKREYARVSGTATA